MPSTPEPRRLLSLLLPILALLGLGLGVVYWPRPQTLVAPPAISAAEVAEATDAVLFGRVGHDLSWRLVAPREDRSAWRRFNDPARQVFVVTRLDEPLRQGELAMICTAAKQDPMSPQPTELAAAYAAIGAARLAEACAGLAAISAPDLAPEPPGVAQAHDPYAAIRRQIRSALAAEDPVKLCARYIRTRATEVLMP